MGKKKKTKKAEAKPTDAAAMPVSVRDLLRVGPGFELSAIDPRKVVAGPADKEVARAEAAEAEAARLQYDLDRQLYRADVLAARVAELEATLGRLDALAPDYELPDGAAVAEAIASGYILTAGCRDIHGKVAGVAAVERNNEMLRARVAELEAQLAAQQWAGDERVAAAGGEHPRSDAQRRDSVGLPSRRPLASDGRAV